MTETSRDRQGAAATARPGAPAPRSPAAARSRPSAWTGWVVFGGAMLILNGAFQIVLGLVALLDEELFVVPPSGLVLDVGYDTWGWVHLAIGVLATLAGLGLLAGNLAARMAAVVLAGVGALAHLAFIPAYPVWSTIVIAVDILIIYAVVAHGDDCGPGEAAGMTQPETGRAEPLRIDEVLPHFDANLVEHVVVDADPAGTYQALLRADLMDNAVTRLLVRARDLPNALRRHADGVREERPARFTVRDAGGEEAGWVLLRDDPGVEFLVGLVGRFWQRNYGIVRLRPDEFEPFDQPGYAKTVAGFSLHPYGAHRTLLTYENRTATTDEEARRRFRVYWMLLRPFVAVLMRSSLVAVKREAEHAGTPHASSSFASRR